MTKRSLVASSPSVSLPSVDSKLLHLIKKLVVNDDIERIDLDHTINRLTTQHREYQRKDPAWLKRNVERVIERISIELSNHKRLKAEEHNDEEEQYDMDAAEADAIGEQLAKSTSMSLNDGLVNRYKAVQQEKEAKEAAEAAATKKKLKKRKSKSSPDSSGNPDQPSFLSPVARPSERYTDLGGVADILQLIKQLVEYPLVRPELYRHLGVDPPRGVLLRGPPGCGKSHLANAIAGQLGLPFFRVAAPELVSGMSGESEGRIRDLFQAASDHAPSVIFMDELDAICPKRSEGGRGMEQRMVAQLLTCMDMLHPKYNRNQASVIVLGATNRPDAMDPALRRAGRFDKEIILGVPDEKARIAILKTMTRDMRLDGDFCFKELARKTPGYVGADVRSLTKEAAVIAINRIFQDVLTDEGARMPSAQQLVKLEQEEHGDVKEEANDDTKMDQDTDLADLTPLSPDQLEPLFVTMADFLGAIPHVQPSSKREGFATVPDVSWDDIGALANTREELTLSVLEPIRHPEKFQALGLSLPAGVLLYGPPGCGKTLLAKAIANESGANFLSVKGPELLDKYVGESERAVRVVFERARASAPCVVFFDELDSLAPKRGSDSGSGGGGVSERVVNQLLTEMDGLESRRSVFVIAATNRPELIDPAMMRPGRLDKLLYVSLPTPSDRVSILTALAVKVKLAQDVNLDALARSHRADGYSGADCAALLREAGLAVLKESIADASTKLEITRRHFDYAFDHVLPSVSVRDQQRYDKMRDRMARARTRVGGVNDEALVVDGDDVVKDESTEAADAAPLVGP
jgi:ribosome biogenesis ATPase